jgi:transposase
MEPLSIRDRETIVKHKQAGKSGYEIAQWLMVHRQTVSRVWQQFLTTGNVTPKPKNSGRKPKITQPTMEKILSKIEKQPDTTLNGLIDKFSLPVSEAALSNRLKKEGLTYKKRHYIQTTNNETTLSKPEILGETSKKS